MSVCSALHQFLNHSHEFDIVELIFMTIIAKFGMGMKDLVTFITNSLPKKEKFPLRKMLAIKVCRCKDIATKHYIVEQSTDGQNMYTVNFQKHNIEITQNSDNDILTHILIMLLRTRESYWTSSSTSSNKKAHEIALRLAPYIVEEITLSSSSESDSEKENSPVKKSLKRVKQRYQDINDN